jgi:hypothetical protein
MDRENAKQTLLDYGWDAAERHHIAEALHFAEQDAACQQALGAYDRVRAALRPDGDAAEPVGGCEAFAARIAQTARPRRLRAWLRVSATAAGILLGAVGGYTWRTAATARAVESGAEPRVAPAFAAHEVRDSVAVFKQVAEVFDQRASWVLVGDQASDVGLGRDPAQPEDRLLVLRLVLSKGSEVVSSADLVTVPDGGADVTVPMGGGLRLRYHIATGGQPQTRLSIWAELERTADAGRALASVATELPLQPGQVLRAGEMVTATGRYALNVAVAQARLTGNGS